MEYKKIINAIYNFEMQNRQGLFKKPSRRNYRFYRYFLNY